MFIVGQRVVCIHDFGEIYDLAIKEGISIPKKGVVYTVRSVNKDRIDKSEIIVLQEIVNRVHKYIESEPPFEPWFRSEYFRPLNEKRIEVFRNMLVPKSTRANA